MRTHHAWKWPTLAATTFVAAAAVATVCKTTSICEANTPPQAKVRAVNLVQGEKAMGVAQKTSQVHHANETNFRDMVLKSDVPVLVDFYADWCGPCQRIAPILEELAAETPHARIVKVNVDKNPGLAVAYGISAIPNLMVFKDGKVVEQIAGLASKRQLEALLDADGT